MKIIKLFLLLLAAQAQVFSFGGGYDSLLFDGSVKQVLPEKSDCTVKLTYVTKSVDVIKYIPGSYDVCGISGTEVKTEKVTMTKPGDIESGSEIVTGAESFAEVELDDGSILRIAPNSSVKISDDYCTNRTLRQKAGSIWHKVKKLLGSKSYEVTTNGANCGVRGTEFEVIVNGNNTEFKVFEGSVEITPVMNDESNKALIKAYEQMIKDMETGKITANEFTEKSAGWTEIMEGSRQFPKVLVEAGNMVSVTFEVSKPESIPGGETHWFDDSNFIK